MSRPSGNASGFRSFVLTYRHYATEASWQAAATGGSGARSSRGDRPGRAVRRGSMVLIGAADDDAEFYRGIADRLAAHWRVVTYDRRGTRRSGREGWPSDSEVSRRWQSENGWSGVARPGIVVSLRAESPGNGGRLVDHRTEETGTRRRHVHRHGRVHGTHAAG